MAENSLSESRARGAPQAASSTPPPQATSRRSSRARSATPDSREEAATSSSDAVPAEVRQRFVQVGRNYHFPDGAPAFTDRGKRLTTPSENTEVVKTLISIAQARGWAEVSVRGTERFRREAWSAARLAGLEVRGYRPSDVEQERLVRALARQTGVSRNSMAADAESQKAPSPDPGMTVSDEAPRRRDKDGTIAGRLIEHGPAPYKNEPGAARSYFVRLETDQGERTVWGVDLERAMRGSLSQPKGGDEVGLRRVRREPVTVKANERNELGEVVGQREKATHRNAWIIEKADFLVARAVAARAFADSEVTAKDALRKNPELLGSYLQLRSAEVVAAERIRDPQDQRQFVGLVRSAIAEQIASGAPLPPVRLRENAPARAPRDLERVASPVRG